MRHISILSLLLLLLLQVYTNAQISIANITNIGGTGAEDAYGIHIDNTGNHYVTGSFSSALNVGAIPLNNVGGADIFIAKYNSTGGVDWVKSAGSAGADGGRSITTDSKGNVYAAGTFRATVSFGNYQLSTGASILGSTDGYVVKYNSLSQEQWAIQLGDPSNMCVITEIITDKLDNIYIAGDFQNNMTAGTLQESGKGGRDAFIAKIDTSGNVLWVNSFGGPKNDYGLDIATDNANNIYLTGTFTDSIDIAGTMHQQAGSSSGSFAVKLDPQGNVMVEYILTSTGFIKANGITVDQQQNVIVVGTFKEEAYYNTNTFPSYNKTGDGFILKLTNNGSIEWFQSISCDKGGSISDVVSDNNNRIYTIGTYQDSLILPNSFVKTNGHGDVFSLLLDPSGNILDKITGGSSFSSESARCIAMNDIGNVAIVGKFWSTAQFDNMFASSKGSTDAFIIKYQPIAVSQKEIMTKGANISLYPNPTSQTIHFEEMPEASNYEILNIDGKVTQKGQLQSQIDISNLSTGNYLFRVSNNKSILSIQSFIKQ